MDLHTPDPAMHYTNATVRELAWAISAPLMLRGSESRLWPEAVWCRSQGGRAGDWLRELDRHPASLQRYLDAETDRRLGARFERLIEFWLSHSPDFELLHRRLQCHDSGRTIGEFDFIVINNLTGETEHWEVATKFYLGVATPDAPHKLEWVGPGKRDRLLRKERHLVNQQAMLGRTPAAQEFLRSLGIRLDRVRAIVKGRLFYPQDFDGTPNGSTRLTANHDRGFWCTRTAALDLPVQEWVARPKERWLEPPGYSRADASEAPNFGELLAQAGQRPMCVDVRPSMGRFQRVMVVPDDWGDDLMG